jgi:ABC-2 type transport system permease protein
MRAFLTIAANTFLELIRQPVFLLLNSGTTSFVIILAGLPYFGFGEDAKLVRDAALAITLFTGLLAAVLAASSAVNREIRVGTALAVLSKPVARGGFLLGKFCGIAGAVWLLAYANLLASLLASRMAYDAYGDPDGFGIALFFGGLALSFAFGAFTNYFHHRNLAADAFRAQIVLLTVVFLILAFGVELKHPGQSAAQSVDWRLLPAGALILCALLLLSAIALACSTRLDSVPTLIVCTIIFFAGLISDYAFGQAAEQGLWWGRVGHAVLPNWQLFWITDAIQSDRTLDGIWRYVAKSVLYLACHLTAVLLVAYALFEDRDLAAND